MKILLEPFGGIAGDMTLAALFDLGVDPETWKVEMGKLELDEAWELNLSRVERHSIVAAHVHFTVDGRPVEEPFLSSDNHAHFGHAAKSAGGHQHESADHHHDPADEVQPGMHPTSARHVHGRTYTAIRKLIDSSDLAPRVKQRAGAIFERLGQAEAKLHGRRLEDVHFHEVGSLDAILDVVGVCVALELLGVDEIRTLALPVGEGKVETAHGVLPLPAPATLELLHGLPLRRVDLDYETVTPTGAAIVAALAEAAPLEEYRLLRSGYGAGTKDDPRIANFLRIHELELASGEGGLETITVLETIVDDATPEWVAHALECLRESGALDAYLSPVTTKKNRQGFAVTVIARPGDAETLRRILFEETPTLGIRSRTETRHVLSRRAGTVDTPWGPVDVKIARLPDGRERTVPEYESCAELSRRAGVPLWEVYRMAAGGGDK